MRASGGARAFTKLTETTTLQLFSNLNGIGQEARRLLHWIPLKVLHAVLALVSGRDLDIRTPGAREESRRPAPSACDKVGNKTQGEHAQRSSRARYPSDPVAPC